MKLLPSTIAILAMITGAFLGSVRAQQQQVQGIDGLTNFNSGPRVIRMEAGQLVETGLATAMECSQCAGGITYWPLKVRCSWDEPGKRPQTQFGAFDLLPGQNVAFNHGEVNVICAEPKMVQ